MLCTVTYLSRANINTHQQEVLGVPLFAMFFFHFGPTLLIYEEGFSKN